jgi:hypothetical protein
VSRYRDDDEQQGAPAPSRILPTDTFDALLARLVGLPNGGHTAPSVVQSTDFYGNTTSYMVQTVRTEEGATIFVTQVTASGSIRYVLPPAVLRLIDRQRDTTTTQIRRRHGKRLAEERGPVTFTPEQRAKALATRKRKAAERAARKGKAGRS